MREGGKTELAAEQALTATTVTEGRAAATPGPPGTPAGTRGGRFGKIIGGDAHPNWHGVAVVVFILR